MASLPVTSRRILAPKVRGRKRRERPIAIRGVAEDVESSQTVKDRIIFSDHK